MSSVGATTAHSRFQVMATRGLTPFVGRAAEVAELERALGRRQRARARSSR
jgi:hypothetical protein